MFLTYRNSLKFQRCVGLIMPNSVTFGFCKIRYKFPFAEEAVICSFRLYHNLYLAYKLEFYVLQRVSHLRMLHGDNVFLYNCELIINIVKNYTILIVDFLFESVYMCSNVLMFDYCHFLCM